MVRPLLPCSGATAEPTRYHELREFLVYDGAKKKGEKFQPRVLESPKKNKPTNGQVLNSTILWNNSSTVVAGAAGAMGTLPTNK